MANDVWVWSAPFLQECISQQDLDEMNVEIIRNTLYKAYLEDFYRFCKEQGGATEDVMCGILEVSNLLSYSLLSPGKGVNGAMEKGPNCSLMLSPIKTMVWSLNPPNQQQISSFGCHCRCLLRIVRTSILLVDQYYTGRSIYVKNLSAGVLDIMSPVAIGY